MIKLRFTTLDGIRKTKKFKTLAGARKAAHDWVGTNAEIGSYYAISGDGVVKVTTEGCKLTDIWPVEDGDCDDGQGPRESYETGGGEFDPGADYGDEHPPRPTGCTCSDYQLIQVGCDCAATRNDDIPF